MTMTNRNTDIDLDIDNIHRLEREARQMRAEAVSGALVAFGRFIARRWHALRGNTGHQAA
jgi:hypothetical protein